MVLGCLGAFAPPAKAQPAPAATGTLIAVRVSPGPEQTAVFFDFDRPIPYLDQLRPSTEGTALEIQLYGAVAAPGVAAQVTPIDVRIHSISISPAPATTPGSAAGLVVRIEGVPAALTRVSSLTSPFRILALFVDATKAGPESETVNVVAEPGAPTTNPTIPTLPRARSTEAPGGAAAEPALPKLPTGEDQASKPKRRKSKVAADNYDEEALGGDSIENPVDTGVDTETGDNAKRKTGSGAGSPSNMQLNADRVVQDRQFNEFIAEGSVHAVYGDVEIRCDRLVYRANSSEVQADGNVWLLWSAGSLRGASVNLSLDTLTGVVFDGSFTSSDGDVTFHGAKIEKTGENDYHVEDGKLTSCSCTPPDWSFTGQDMDITVGGYARGVSTAFRLWDVPTLWAPYMIVPVKTDRETGLLIPRVGYSSLRGFQLEQPFFWAISRNADATFTLETSTEERLGGDIDVRYIRTLKSAGEIEARYFQDKNTQEPEVDSNGNPISGRVDRERYAIEAFHDEIFSQGVRGKVLVDVLSDTQVNRDTSDDITARSQQFTQSKATITSSWRRWSLLGAVRWYEDLQSDANNELQDLPEITLRGIDQPIPGTPIELDMRSDATDFFRREGADGLRWDTTPRFFIPIQVSHFNLEPSLSPRATVYYADVALNDEVTDPVTGKTTTITSLERKSAGRLLPDADVTLDTTLSRIYLPSSDDPTATRWKHEIDPYLEYEWIPEIDQTALPEFDRVDRIAAKSLVTYGVEQTLFSREGKSGSINSPIDVTIEHSFDLLNTACPTGVCPIHGELALSPLSGLSIGAYTDWDPVTGRFADYTLRMGLNDRRGDRLSSRYRFVDGRIEDVNAGGRVVLWEGTALYGVARYDQLNAEFLEEDGGIHFTAPCDCWGFDLWVIDRANPQETKFGIQFNFEGLGSTGQAPWWANHNDQRRSLLDSGT